MKRLFSIFCLMFLVNISIGQTELLDSVALAMQQEYTDLNAALQNKESVIKLSLRKKKLKSFPMEILQLKNLQYLDLSKNTIKELPDSIVKLKNLQYLIVSKTGLESLPKNIGDLTNLKYIDCSQNEIAVLPYSFGYLVMLEHADFWDNNLDEFPATMKNLQNLKKLDLRSILISKTKQENLQNILPNTKIYFSPPCNCGL